jgi:arginine/ornithine N-succinyltransferase beta subunit
LLQFYNLDLSDTDIIMQKCYSKFGLNPRLPVYVPFLSALD